MAPHVARMKEESEQLSDRLAKLNTFLDGPIFPTLNETDQALLGAQAGSMAAYKMILEIRIARASGLKQEA